MHAFNTPKAPLPQPARGAVTGSFAHHTVTIRFPKIVQDTIQDNHFPSQVNQQLQQIIKDIPLAPLRELKDVDAPDSEDWTKYLQSYQGQNWLEVPWFFAEMYFYRRILEATGYYQPGKLQGYDPFQSQKQRVLETAVESTDLLAKELDEALRGKMDEERLQTNLERLVVLNVWSNQADLSMWSASEDRPDHQDSNDQRTHLLVNQARRVGDFLLSRGGPLNRVDFILDNYGPELIHDIGLADYLLGNRLVKAVRFHAKPAPHYVSDAMIEDVHATFAYLANHPALQVRQLADRTKSYLRNNRLEIVTNHFWTSPTYFWEMPGYILDELSAADLVISKGDANYRRLAGDLKWPSTTPFQDVVRYFPTSLLALRVLKAELALGLTPTRVSQLEDQDPDWQSNGRWAVIQFWQKNLSTAN